MGCSQRWHGGWESSAGVPWPYFAKTAPSPLVCINVAMAAFIRSRRASTDFSSPRSNPLAERQGQRAGWSIWAHKLRSMCDIFAGRSLLVMNARE